MKKFIVSIFVIIIIIFLLFPGFVQAYLFPDFKYIKSVTHYPFPRWDRWDQLDQNELEEFNQEIEKMKASGINAIWFVTPWMVFEPVASPEDQRQYNQASFDNLKTVVTLLEQENMTAVLPLGYFGVGWSPQGVDPLRWPLDSQTWNAFRDYIARMSDELKNNQNILFLFYSEGADWQGERLEIAQTDPEISQHFRDWAYGINPDLSYWNQRWGISYASWSEVIPFHPEATNTVNKWTDHHRWTAYIIRNTLGTLDQVVKQYYPTAKVGFHDLYVLPCAQHRIACSGESPLPDNHDFDLFSIVNYPKIEIATSSSYWVEELKIKISQVREKHPELPVFLGEVGMNTNIWTTEQQQDILPAILLEAKAQEIGFNIWKWKDSPDITTDQGLGLHDVNGNEKPIFQAIKPLLKTIADLNGDGQVDSQDYEIIIAKWLQTSDIDNEDFNQDGRVDARDLGIMMSNWTGGGTVQKEQPKTLAALSQDNQPTAINKAAKLFFGLIACLGFLSFFVYKGA